ncbi:MAG TPA: histidinol dehydrogenase [Terriglobia bacterium]|nr:histidinol dehydrogenase [Terriglobia bacterium]
MIKIIRSTHKEALERLFASRMQMGREGMETARRILEEVRKDGDAALARLAKRLDGVDLKAVGFKVSEEEIRNAAREVPREFMKALREASVNIRRVAQRQLPRPWRMANGKGVEIRQIVRPLERVACYVPGGRFPLPSTVLMSVIPAQVAGVHEIFITTPRPSHAILAAANLLGVRNVYRLGGAHAIGAFAYGTKTVPRVDKIVGPGNRYVAAAKSLVAGVCGIDFVAGPTEVAVAGSTGNPRWIAAELVAQAEHDPDALAVFITSSARLATQVQKVLDAIVKKLQVPVAQESLARQGAIIVAKDLAEVMRLVNRLAPEHLLLLDDAAKRLNEVQSAGSIFLGCWSPVAAGDYASGPNHTLPTGGAARVRGGLSSADFVKAITVQRLRPAGLARLRRTIVTLAAAEGLKAHAHSIETRFADASAAQGD